MGSLRGGHYTATIASGDDDAWYEFDDAHVRKVTTNMRRCVLFCFFKNWCRLRLVSSLQVKDQLFTRSPTLRYVATASHDL